MSKTLGSAGSSLIGANGELSLASAVVKMPRASAKRTTIVVIEHRDVMRNGFLKSIRMPGFARGMGQPFQYSSFEVMLDASLAMEFSDPRSRKSP